MTTKLEAMAALKAVLDCIEEAIDGAGTQGIPSGHLYAMLMGHLSLDTYQSIISAMKQSGRITERHHCLYTTKVSAS